MSYDYTIPKVVIDNGNGFIKAGVVGKNRNPIILPNCIGQHRKRGIIYVADNCYTCSEYFCLRPQHSSIVLDPIRQLLIWEKVIGKPSNSLSVSPEKIGLIVTGPLLMPQTSLRALSEIIFENLNIPVAAFIPAQTACNFSQYSKLLRMESYSPGVRPPDSNHGYTLVVDMGFSSTHATPLKNGIPILNASLRSNIGGNHLNAYLKNVISLRSLDLNFNELLVQHIREESCYVSPNIDEECKLATKLKNRKLAYEYIIPEYVKNKSQMANFFSTYRSNPKSLLQHDLDYLSQPPINGYKDNNMQVDSNDMETDVTPKNNHFYHPIPYVDNTLQRVRLYAECFTLPEALFSPDIIGLSECGVVDLICKSLSKCPVETQSLLAGNILLCGGNAKIKGFKQRLYKELKSSLPDHWKVCIRQSANPQLSAYYGACVWASDPNGFPLHAITRQAFFENGQSIR